MTRMMQFTSPEAASAFYVDLKRRKLQHCPVCNTAKKQAEFAPSAWGQHGHYCRECKKTINKDAYRRKWAFVKPAQRRERTYGIDDEFYRALWTAQGGKCGCCDKDLLSMDPRNVHVDHDHRTGVNRGILCRDCNIGLGCFFDDPVMLKKAAKYLEDHAAVMSLPATIDAS